MSLWSCYLQGWMKFVDFTGRATRKEFWVFTVVNSILLLALVIASLIIFYVAIYNSDTLNLLAVFFFGFSIILILPFIAVGCRRMHDINRSGWWFIILLFASLLLKFLILFILLSMENEDFSYRDSFFNSSLFVNMISILVSVSRIVLIYLCCQQSKTATVGIAEPI